MKIVYLKITSLDMNEAQTQYWLLLLKTQR